MSVQKFLEPLVKEGISAIYGVQADKIEFQETRKDFEGDITLVIFPLLRIVKGNPAVIAQSLGEYLLEHSPIVERFNVVKGFLNLVITDAYYLDYFLNWFVSTNRLPWVFGVLL